MTSGVKAITSPQIWRKNVSWSFSWLSDVFFFCRSVLSTTVFEILTTIWQNTLIFGKFDLWFIYAFFLWDLKMGYAWNCRLYIWLLFNPRPAGGGGGRNGPPSTFPSIAQKRKGVGLRNFREPLPTSILHMLTKGKFRTYDRSAVSDVRVTSCSAILGQK